MEASASGYFRHRDSGGEKGSVGASGRSGGVSG